MTWTHFRSLRRTVDLVLSSDGEYQKDLIVLCLFTAVTAVETFVNVYFRVLVEEDRFLDSRDIIMTDLEPPDGARPKGIDYKLRHWPHKVLGKSLAWQSGPAARFDVLRTRRNELMHFVGGHNSIDLPGLKIDGLADTSCFDNLTSEDAIDSLETAMNILEEIFRLQGLNESEIAHALHSWSGVPPGAS